MSQWHAPDAGDDAAAGTPAGEPGGWGPVPGPPAAGPGAPPAPGAPAPGAPAPGGAAQGTGGGWGEPRWNDRTGAWDRPPPSVQPGIVPLRPLGLGEICDGAFRAFRQNPRVMVGLSAIVVLATQLVSLVATVVLTRDLVGLFEQLGSATATPSFSDVAGTLQRSIPLYAVVTLLQSIAVLVLNGMLIVAVSRAVLGRTVTLGELWRQTRHRVPALVGLSLVVSLVPTLIGLVLLAPGVLVLVGADGDGAIATGVALTLVGALAWLVLAVFIGVRWALATPALLLEQLTVRESVRRSSRLVRGTFWRTFGILALTLVVVYVVVTAVGFPFSVVGQLIGTVLLDGGSTTTGLVVQQAVASIGTMLGSVVAFPFLASVTALVYVDLRMRREGLDVELHRAAAGG
ncbi:hypothetical protein GTR02_11865 [Kineococcus sp. R8]|uniref:glycerophosphoryl diester phosphodiesterase membrane domain-containing protein n=1 Tax=Kineococcus siccus TaxID=2696567 RepID=UPI00141326F4|nr:glycerophosphoryl diester phosphodiesterase membrane domain-containing protein [Kineococcus siccus]NAZ82517.1 hypothetical protein [Kineococcus siccus]